MHLSFYTSCKTCIYTEYIFDMYKSLFISYSYFVSKAGINALMCLIFKRAKYKNRFSVWECHLPVHVYLYVTGILCKFACL